MWDITFSRVQQLIRKTHAILLFFWNEEQQY